MVQATTWGVPRSGPATPTVMAERMDDSLDAILSAHSGTTAPSYAVKGTVWLDTSVAGTMTHKVYDGLDWIVIGTVDESANTFIPGVSASGVRTVLGLQNVPLDGASGFRNAVINGNFDIWQRATSQTSGGYGSADRFDFQVNGSTFTASQQSFSLGQTDVPGNPRYYCQMAVTSVAGAGNYARMVHKIERVSKFSGQTRTFTVYMNADAAKDVAFELVQNFGTGGSPSAEVTAIGVQKETLATGFNKITFTVDIPSVSGKTLGTNNNDYLAIIVWFDAGSDFNARTDSLGQQSGTYGISRMSFVLGDATAETDPYSPRHIGQELALCRRYYQKYNFASDITGLTLVGFSTSAAAGHLPFLVSLRASPTISSVGPITANLPGLGGITFSGGVAVSAFASGASIIATGGTSVSVGYPAQLGSGIVRFDAEL